MRINHRGDIERERVPFMVICKERCSSLAKKSFLLFYLIKMSNGCLSLSWSKNETNGGAPFSANDSARRNFSFSFIEKPQK
jgi:hypothetical protein